MCIFFRVDAGYIRATAGLCIFALATDIFATLLTGERQRPALLPFYS